MCMPKSSDSKSPIRRFVIVSGPFRFGAEQWPLDIKGSWETEDWTKTYIPICFPHAEILQFNILEDADEDMACTEFFTKPGFEKQTMRLLNLLKAQDLAAGQGKIIFLSHGFGGSLVKNVLVTACTSVDYFDVLESTQVLIFFDTPHRIQSPDTFEDLICRMLSEIEPEQRSQHWKVSEMAGILEELCTRWRLIGCSWQTLVVRAVPHGDHQQEVLSFYNATFDGHFGEVFELKKSHQTVTGFGGKFDELYNLFSNTEERGFGLYAECMKKLASANDAPPINLLTDFDGFELEESLGEDSSFKTWSRSDKAGVLLLTRDHTFPDAGAFGRIAAHFRTMNQQHIATFYKFRRSDARKNTLSSFLVSTIQQILNQEAGVFRKHLYSDTIGYHPVSERGLLNFHRGIIQTLEGSHILIMVDNVDECKDLEALLRYLRILSRYGDPTIKLLLSADPSSRCFEVFKGAPITSVEHRPMKVPHFRQQIEKQIEILILQRPILSEIRGEILERIDACLDSLEISSFIYQLQISPVFTITEVTRHKLSTIKPDIHSHIEHMLEQSLPPWLLNAFFWVLSAVTPLNVNELAVAASLQEYFYDLRGLNTTISRSILDDLNQAIGPFFTEECGEIKFGDDLMKEKVAPKLFSTFMAQVKGYRRNHDEWQITKACVDYLCTPEVQSFAKSPPHHHSWISQKKSKFAFAPFAAKNWPLQYKASVTTKEQDMYIFMEFADARFTQTWAALSPYSDLGDRPVPSTAVHFIALHGLTRVLNLIQEPYDGEQMDSDVLHDSIYFAAKNGHADTIKWLLNYGVVNPREIVKIMEWTCGEATVDVINILRQQIVESNLKCLGIRQNQLLNDAARNGHFSLLELLLRAKKSENNDDIPPYLVVGTGNALHSAVKVGHSAIAESLLREGEDINGNDVHGNSALHLACKNNDTEMVELLLRNGAKVDKVDSGGYTALQLAVIQRNLDIMSQLLDAGADPGTRSIPSSTSTPLHEACERNYREIVDVLLTRGADINLVDSWSSTSLQSACYKGHYGLAEHLIQEGARTDIASSESESELDALIHNITGQVSRQFANSESDKRSNLTSTRALAWMEAQQRSAIPLVKLLLKGGAGRIWNKKNWKTLHAAASIGLGDIVALLLDHEFSVNCRGRKNRTALHTAAYEGHLDTVKLLLDRGANINAVDSDQGTCLHSASKGNRVGVISELLNRHACIEALDESGRSPLHTACYEGCTDAAKLLIDCGAEFDTLDSSKMTPLFHAVNSQLVEVASILLRKGACAQSTNSNGNLILHTAASKGNISLIELLVTIGEAKLNSCDVEGRVRNSSHLLCLPWFSIEFSLSFFFLPRRYLY